MITCPQCGCPTTVAETRDTGVYVRRRRHCASITCNKRITTVEMVISTGPHGLLTDAKLGNDLVLVHRKHLEETATLISRMLSTARTIPTDATEPTTEGTSHDQEL